MSSSGDNENKGRLPKLPDQLRPSEPLKRFNGIGLPVALGIGVAAALLLVGISMGLYLNSNLSRIDLSKPKYAEARTEVEEFPDQQDEYSDEGPVTQETIREAIDLLKERRKELREAGDFTDPVLSDEALGLGK